MAVEALVGALVLLPGILCLGKVFG